MPDTERQRSYVYTLSLTNGAYYIGSCRGHLNVRGGPWTKVERKSPPEWWDPTMERSRRLYGTRPSPAETPSTPLDGPVPSQAPVESRLRNSVCPGGCVPDRFEAPVSPTLSPASSQPLAKEE